MVHVVPALIVPGEGVALVKHVQVQEPTAMQEGARRVDMAVPSVIALYYRVAILEVPGVALAVAIRRSAVLVNVEVAPVR